MSTPEPSFSLNVDVANPGQFFACCGLLELAHRLWLGVEGWFDPANACFAVSTEDSRASLEHLFDQLRKSQNKRVFQSFGIASLRFL